MCVCYAWSSDLSNWLIVLHIQSIHCPEAHCNTKFNPNLHCLCSAIGWLYILLDHVALLLLQPFYGSLDFVPDNLGELVLEETFTIILYLLHPSFTIHGILLVQFTCLAVFFHNLCPSFLWSTSWPGTLHFILHIFLHPIIVFFAAHARTIATCFAVVPILCHLILVSLLTLYLSGTILDAKRLWLRILPTHRKRLVGVPEWQ